MSNKRLRLSTVLAMVKLQRLASATIAAGAIFGGGIAFNAISLFAPVAEPALAVACNWSSSRPLPWEVNVRADKTTGSTLIGKKPPGVILNFEAWEDGQAVPDAWDGKPDSKWFKLRGEPGWVASAVIPGYPPESCKEVIPPPPNSLFPNPTSSNPLRGFRDPLDGRGVYSAAHSAPQQYADDLGVSVGTPIKAMRGGKVIGIKQDVSDVLSGPAGNKSQELNVNYVLIEHDQDVKHSSGRFYRSLYLHIQKNSVRVRVGDRVAAGDVIANTGNNGWSTGPHLHVDVNYPTGSQWYQRQTVPYVWDSGRNK